MEVHAIRTWVDLKSGGVVKVTDDVQNVVRDLREISDRLHVYWNEQSEAYDIVESCLDGTDRLVCSQKTLDQRLVQRVREADHWRGQDRPNHILEDDKDFAAQMDAMNDADEEERREAFREHIRDAGERIHWALDLGPGQHSVGGSILVPGAGEKSPRRINRVKRGLDIG